MRVKRVSKALAGCILRMVTGDVMRLEMITCGQTASAPAGEGKRIGRGKRNKAPGRREARSRMAMNEEIDYVNELQKWPCRTADTKKT